VSQAKCKSRVAVFNGKYVCKGGEVMENIKENQKLLNTTHETAVIHPRAKIGQNVQIGPMVLLVKMLKLEIVAK
jgi:UDP-3-O-[3-hydroxymyristoyl] glucosamine N-acyltransferase